ERSGTQAPASVRRYWHRDLWQLNASDIVTITVSFWNQNYIGRAHENRRKVRQNTLVERRSVVEQISGSHESVVDNAWDSRKTNFTWRHSGNQSPVFSPSHPAVWRLRARGCPVV